MSGFLATGLEVAHNVFIQIVINGLLNRGFLFLLISKLDIILVFTMLPNSADAL